uniref:Uncharacterized protein n=1 Tax=Arundo donax TaxID=35708 RepID=A0A0A9GHW1_ARUDO
MIPQNTILREYKSHYLWCHGGNVKGKAPSINEVM